MKEQDSFNIGYMLCVTDPAVQKIKILEKYLEILGLEQADLCDKTGGSFRISAAFRKICLWP